MSTVHIFHHNDWDGKMSAAVMYQYFRGVNSVTNYSFWEVDYTMELANIPEDFDDGDYIVFVDYSFSKDSNMEWLKKLIAAKSYNIIWIDHHKSSKEIIGKPIVIDGLNYNPDILLTKFNTDIVIDTEFCATFMAWKYCYTLINKRVPTDDQVPKLIKYIDSHDTFKNNMPNTEECHYGVMGYKYTPSNIFKKIFNSDSERGIFDPEDQRSTELMNRFVKKMIQSGTGIKKYVDRRNEVERESVGFPFTINDKTTGRIYKCFAMNIHGNSLVFGDLYNQYDIVCPFILIDGRQWKYSLFTHDPKNIDCSYIAKWLGTYDGLGGGGHAGAAGFQTYDCILVKGCEIELSFSKFRKNPKIDIDYKR